MNITRILIVCFSLLYLYSCTSNVKELKEVACNVVERLYEYPDSTFFSDIRHAEYEDGKLYLLDTKRGDIIWLSEDFKRMDYVARHSEVDLVMPASFTVWQDTAYIYDEGSVNSLKIYADGCLVSSVSIPRCNEKRMGVSESSLFLSLPTDSSCFIKIEKQDLTKYILSGRVAKKDTPERTVMLNDNHLFYNSGMLFAVAESRPYIDKYDAVTNEWLSAFDLSDIPFMRANLNFTATKVLGQKSYYVYIDDCCLYNGYLYLLCASFGDNYHRNTVVKVDVSDTVMKPVCYCVLPGKCYKSICVSSDYLYAICENPCAIEKIRLEDE